jgi:diadenosine tetraphosphatase ApaH/serine/threonine PP2A family protein phosphatase
VGLTDVSRNWLRQLPYTVQTLGVSCTHGSFHRPEKWGYLDTPNAAAASFQRQPTSIAFYGHTHTAGFWQEGGDRFIPAQPKTGTLRLGSNFRYALNPGSVGNPRTPIQKPDPRAQYLIYDTDKLSATFIRVAYNIKACIAVMKAAGLSEEIIGRVELGY